MMFAANSDVLPCGVVAVAVTRDGQPPLVGLKLASPEALATALLHVGRARAERAQGGGGGEQFDVHEAHVCRGDGAGLRCEHRHADALLNVGSAVAVLVDRARWDDVDAQAGRGVDRVAGDGVAVSRRAEGAGRIRGHRSDLDAWVVAIDDVVGADRDTRDTSGQADAERAVAHRCAVERAADKVAGDGRIERAFVDEDPSHPELTITLSVTVCFDESGEHAELPQSGSPSRRTPTWLLTVSGDALLPDGSVPMKLPMTWLLMVPVPCEISTAELTLPEMTFRSWKARPPMIVPLALQLTSTPMACTPRRLVPVGSSPMMLFCT